eukprot:GHVP01040006.1.p1 GENE.GHVP01040006.1~~GHVP01040006.1.p1  ORF type:complete len:187 (+),score=24.98 GHVP01040006.1:688-1248(+)
MSISFGVGFEVQVNQLYVLEKQSPWPDLVHIVVILFGIVGIALAFIMNSSNRASFFFLTSIWLNLILTTFMTGYMAVTSNRVYRNILEGEVEQKYLNSLKRNRLRIQYLSTSLISLFLAKILCLAYIIFRYPEKEIFTFPEIFFALSITTEFVPILIFSYFFRTAYEKKEPQYKSQSLLQQPLLEA